MSQSTHPRPSGRRRIRSSPGTWRRVVVSLALAACLPAALGQGEVDLPQMGDPADQVLSPAQERELGESLMRHVLANEKVIQDPLLHDYVTALGAALTSATGQPAAGFTFFLVDDPAVNAFAAPGGFIGVNGGLILATENEAQLAGVLAHEIAHVTQRHIARAYAEAQSSSLPAAAAILAAILLGGQNPQASQAALATGIAASRQWQLNYTRSNEYEADRLGIRFLAQAGFDPLGMVEFFSLLERRHAGEAAGRPEYLSTHPLSSNRVAEARQRADSLTRPNQRIDGQGFRLARARLRVLTSNNRPALLGLLEQELPTATGRRREVNLYAQALIAHLSGAHERARTIADDLLAAEPDELYYNLLYAANEYAAGRSASGAAWFDKLIDLYPDNLPVLLSAATAAQDGGDHTRAARSLRAALKLPGMHAARSYQLLARAEDKLGQRARSLESLAEHAALLGEQRLAIRHLEQAAGLSQPGSANALRIAARIEQLREQLAARLRQRGG